MGNLNRPSIAVVHDIRNIQHTDYQLFLVGSCTRVDDDDPHNVPSGHTNPNHIQVYTRDLIYRKPHRRDNLHYIDIRRVHKRLKDCPVSLMDKYNWLGDFVRGNLHHDRIE